VCAPTGEDKEPRSPEEVLFDDAPASTVMYQNELFEDSDSSQSRHSSPDTRIDKTSGNRPALSSGATAGSSPALLTPRSFGGDTSHRFTKNPPYNNLRTAMLKALENVPDYPVKNVEL